eukprot:TRINITY_DN1803_c0_g1_i5.p1 TRINITY_DN1803_c0_g1~~TRINITY_DN1803_c0_g1_i5.p1  ORF type:complete len:1157 (+),score=158.63 TRINITY_DN1803_c0_g1_i5:118-3471(+)
MADLRQLMFSASASTTRLRDMMHKPSSRTAVKRASEELLDQWKRKLSSFFQKAASDKALASVLRVMWELRQFAEATCGAHKMLRRSHQPEFVVAESLLGNTLVLLAEDVLPRHRFVLGVGEDEEWSIERASKDCMRRLWCLALDEYLDWCMRSVQQQRRNMLMRSHCRWYIELLQVALDTYAMPPLAQAAGRGMCSFFAQHMLDPFNAIIGLPVAHCVLARIEALEEAHGAFSIEESGITGQELLEEVLSWRTLADEQLRAALQSTLCRISGVHRAVPGDILVVEVTDVAASGVPTSTRKRTIIYARCQHVDQADGIVRVYTDNLESRTSGFPLESVKRLPSTVVDEYIDVEDVQRLERCIQLSEEGSFQIIMEKCTALMLSKLEEESKCSEVLQRALDAKTTLTDYALLKHVHHSLSNLEVSRETLDDRTWATTRDECQALVLSHVQRIECASALNTTFKPTIRRRLADLQGFSFEAAMEGQRQQILGTLMAAIDELEIQRKSLQSGDAKNEMVEWWLNLIDMKVNVFLESYDYHMGAVPDNYIETAPENLEHVHANKHILMRILRSVKSGEDSYMVKPFIEGLKSRIFPVIEQFVHDLTTILEEELGDGACADLPAAKQTAKYKFPEKWVLAGVKDLVYISEMMKMEDPDYPRDAHIIPISGLVLSVFTRLEYECNTVIDLFGWKRGADQMAEAHSDFHKAVVSRDLNGCKHMLRVGADVNAVGPTGCTALHLACMRRSYENEDIELIEELMRNDGDIFFKDSQGLHCLFYLVRARQDAIGSPDAYDSLLRHLFSQATRDDLHIIDDQGNSMVHMAALCNNALAVNMLLEAGIDPNMQNDFGDTPLHKAVTCDLGDIVQLLVNEGAQTDVVNSNGETPVAIAIANNSRGLIQTMGGRVSLLMQATSSSRQRRLRGLCTPGTPVSSSTSGSDSFCISRTLSTSPCVDRGLWRMPESWKRVEETGTPEDVQSESVTSRDGCLQMTSAHSAAHGDPRRFSSQGGATRRATIGNAHRMSIRDGRPLVHTSSFGADSSLLSETLDAPAEALAAEAGRGGIESSAPLSSPEAGSERYAPRSRTTGTEGRLSTSDSPAFWSPNAAPRTRTQSISIGRKRDTG